MPLNPGAEIGSYQVTSFVGSGGMGEVYRANDRRLRRDVAIKILRPELANDADRMSRFEQEARAAAALDHPNVLAVHELGAHDGSLYIVSELLDGATLRDVLDAGPLPPRKAVDYAVQIAHGLAAAHSRGIVHRDLKPENLFVTRDGRVKILDFGLAKLTEQVADQARSLSPTAPGTQPGLVLGTVTYMSPEQVRGQSADARSDIFSLGSILYEMLSGARPFARDTAADTMSAILSSDPPELVVRNHPLAPALDRVVRHCLEKSPDQRFQSARDLAFALDTLSNPSGSLPAPVAAAQSRRRTWWPWAVTALAIPLVAWAGVALRPSRAPDLPTYEQLTFRQGGIVAARFAADGHTVVYGAAWQGSRPEIFTVQHGIDSRPNGLVGADLLSLSPSGDLAVSLNRKFRGGFIFTGTLAQVPVGAGPREVLEDVQAADWAPDGSGMAIVRDVGGRARLEFPIGHVLYATSGWISHPRVSPDGSLVAFIDHRFQRDDAGAISVVDRGGRVRTLSEGWSTAQGLAWSGGDIWFTAARTGNNRALYSVTVDGKLHPITTGPGLLTVMDVAADGRALITADRPRLSVVAVPPGATEERDLSWLDWSRLRYLSDDGKTVIFDETGQGGGVKAGVYLRHTDGSAAVRLGDGLGEDMSADGKWVISTPTDRSRIVLLPTGPGESRTVGLGPVKAIQRAYWFPDGHRILVAGNEAGQPARFYVENIDNGQLTPLTSGGMVLDAAISPDGQWIAVHRESGEAELYPAAGGSPQPLAAVKSTENICRWTPDGHGLLVYDPGEVPVLLYRVDVSTGRRDVVKQIPAPSASPLYGITYLFVTPDLRGYAYCTSHDDSTLYVVRGLTR